MLARTQISIELNDLMCSLTGKIFFEPVAIADCGHLFEREAISLYLAKNSACPICKIGNIPLFLVEIPLIKSLINTLLQEQPHLFEKKYFSPGVLKRLIATQSELDANTVFLIIEHKLQEITALAYLERGEKKHLAGDYDGALADYNQALYWKPDCHMAFNNRGEIKRYLQDYSNAMLDYETAIKLQPNFPIALCNRGLIKHQFSDYEGALADFNAAIKLAPNLAVVYKYRGMTKFAQKEYDLALISFNICLQLDPNCMAYEERANVKFHLKNWLGAKADYDIALKTNVSFIPLLNRATVKFNLQDYKGALIDCDAAASISPFDAELLLKRGIVNFYLKNYHSAMLDFNAALEARPDDADIYRQRSRLKFYMDDVPGAKADWSMAITLNSNFKDSCAVEQATNTHESHEFGLFSLPPCKRVPLAAKDELLAAVPNESVNSGTLTL